jgi:hypothetical protein
LFRHASRPIRNERADLLQATDPTVYLVKLLPVEVGDRDGARFAVLSLHQASRERENLRDREAGVQQAANTAYALDCSGIENSVSIFIPPSSHKPSSFVMAQRTDARPGPLRQFTNAHLGHLLLIAGGRFRKATLHHIQAEDTP